MNQNKRNIFTKLVEAEYASDTKLGSPAADKAASERRMNAMSAMTGGRGFCVPPKAVRVFSDGTTRGLRKRAARFAANARVSEARAPEFMHSAARNRLDGFEPRQMTGFPMGVAA